KVTLIPDALDGDIYIKQNTTVDVPEFYMAKYPITNKQYAEFVDDGGTKPYYWDDSNWNGDNYPVVAMTWYEAVKFCQWLSNKMGENIMLPTDAMWQRAAQGDDNRLYTWGNNWNANLCNNNVDKIGVGKTTP
ncbi:MAG TPA: SUMF1/EgtB/PvdO family nonheme iron enzyme, partial [Aggregatilineales bacterium]|nr:SUMF1/EgtB/PvdO family nonheme iron enzyme [Aggregatilineales bacterium]